MTDAPRPVPRAYPLERKDDVQALWDAAALAALQGYCANPGMALSNDARLVSWVFDTADAFLDERARRLKEPTDG